MHNSSVLVTSCHSGDGRLPCGCSEALVVQKIFSVLNTTQHNITPTQSTEPLSSLHPRHDLLMVPPVFCDHLGRRLQVELGEGEGHGRVQALHRIALQIAFHEGGQCRYVRGHYFNQILQQICVNNPIKICLTLHWIWGLPGSSPSPSTAPGLTLTAQRQQSHCVAPEDCAGYKALQSLAGR